MKKIYTLAILFLSMCFIYGCGNNITQDEVSKSKEPLTILTTSINYEDFMKEFHKIYPDVEIEFISYKGYNQTGYIRECFEANELPDIVTSTYFMDTEMQKDRLIDLSKYSFVNNYTDDWLNKCNVDGSIYLLPSNYFAIGIYYNKTIMDKYGWEIPNNFEELKELSKEIEAVGLNTCLARMDLQGFIFSYFWGLGNTFYFNTEEGDHWKNNYLAGDSNAVGNIEPVLSYLLDWVEAGFILPEDIDVKNIADSFYRGDTVFMLCNGISESFQEIEGVGKMEYGILPWLSPNGESKMIVSNVSRYYGINKKLEEKGQEQKLKDALCFMEFISTEEGMRLLKSDTTTISPLNTWKINEDDMCYEIKDQITGGNSIPFVYSGWDDIVIPMAEELYSVIRKEQTIEECAHAFDAIRDEWLNQGPKVLGYVEEPISKEEAAYIVGRILIESKEGDAALLSLGDYHDFGKENPHGIQCGIYPGDFNLDRLRTVVPAGKLCVVELSGKEILSKKEEGKFYISSKGKADEKPFPYVLVTKNNMELEMDKLYQVIITVNDLSDNQKENILIEFNSPETQDIMEAYFAEYKNVISYENFYEW